MFSLYALYKHDDDDDDDDDDDENNERRHLNEELLTRIMVVLCDFGRHCVNYLSSIQRFSNNDDNSGNNNNSNDIASQIQCWNNIVV